MLAKLDFLIFTISNFPSLLGVRVRVRVRVRVKSSLLCVGKIGFLDFHNFKFSFTPRGGLSKES